MKIIKLTRGNYQRNGIAGEGFFSALMEWKEEGMRKHFRDFLVTFQEYKESASINWETCRVVDLNNPEDSWRGDHFATDLTEFFTLNKIIDIYEYITTN